MADTGADRTLTARGALDSHAARLSSIAGPVTAEVLPLQRHYDLRLDPAGPASADVEAVLGVPLPAVLSWSLTPGGQTVVWLGPDEWLVIDPAGSPDLEAQLRAAAGVDGAVVEQSGQRISLVISGDARGLLAKGTGLDLGPSAFPVGAAQQSHLAQAVVVFLSREQGYDARVELLVRTSFARYVADWVLDAASDPLAYPARP